MKRYEGPNSFDEYVLASDYEAEIAEYRKMLAKVMTYTIIPNAVTNEVHELLVKYEEEG